MPSPQSFTIKANGILRVLSTRAKVFAAYDPAALAAQGAPLPPFEEVTAIWDTGANGSVITQDIVDKLGLKAISMVKVHGVHGEGMSEVFLVNIARVSNSVFAKVQVTKGILTGGAQMLIGMDIISSGDFAVTNFHGQTFFSFRCPSQEHIDFVAAKPPATDQ